MNPVSGNTRVDSGLRARPDSGAEDMWGREIPDDESGDEEVARLLMPLNWLCDLLDRMENKPSEAEEQRAACDEFMRRLLASCRSSDLRDAMVDATVWIAARRFDAARAVLRAITA